MNKFKWINRINSLGLFCTSLSKFPMCARLNQASHKAVGFSSKVFCKGKKNPVKFRIIFCLSVRQCIDQEEGLRHSTPGNKHQSWDAGNKLAGGSLIQLLSHQQGFQNFSPANPGKGCPSGFKQLCSFITCQLASSQTGRLGGWTSASDLV